MPALHKAFHIHFMQCDTVNCVLFSHLAEEKTEVQRLRDLGKVTHAFTQVLLKPTKHIGDA